MRNIGSSDVVERACRFDLLPIWALLPRHRFPRTKVGSAWRGTIWWDRRPGLFERYFCFILRRGCHYVNSGEVLPWDCGAAPEWRGWSVYRYAAIKSHWRKHLTPTTGDWIFGDLSAWFSSRWNLFGHTYARYDGLREHSRRSPPLPYFMMTMMRWLRRAKITLPPCQRCRFRLLPAHATRMPHW